MSLSRAISLQTSEEGETSPGNEPSPDLLLSPEDAQLGPYFKPTERPTFCKWKGAASYYAITVGDKNVAKEKTVEMLTPQSQAFLMEGTRTGKLATVRADGRSHVVPIWFVLDGDTLVFTTGGSSVKAANMRRDPRVTLCVDDETPPYAYIMVEGTISFSDDSDELLHWATRIGERYMGAARAEEYGKRNGVPGELLVRITPTKIIFQENIAG